MALIDQLLECIKNELPGEELERGWRWGSPEIFTRRYGAGLRYAVTKSYVTCIYNGHCLFRVWVRQHTAPFIDLHDALAAQLADTLPSHDIPEGLLRKCAPMTKRGHVYSVEEMKAVTDMVKRLYGL